MRKLFRIGPEAHSFGSSNGTTALSSWQPGGNFIATVGSNAIVHVWDRHGERLPGGDVELRGSGKVVALEWDSSGEALAVLQENSTAIEIWDLKTKQTNRVDTNLKDLSYLSWSKTGPELAVGTAKGHLLIYNNKTRRKVPIFAKHPKRITCGAWSNSNRLALGSEDKTLTISDVEGNTEDHRDMKSEPVEMCFSTQKGARKTVRDGEETHLSVNLGSSLLLYELSDPDNPLELAFQQKYGRILSHIWFDDGHIMLGFSEGYLVVISTQLQEIGEELFSGRFHHKQLFDIAYSPVMKLAACCGDSGVKIIDCSKGFEDVKPEELNLAHERCTKVDWSPDGQILTAASSQGSVHAFLARMKIMHASSDVHVAYLSSLREVSIVDIRTALAPLKVPVSIEPQFISLGSMHVAVGSGKDVFFYLIGQGDCKEVYRGEYVARVDSIRVNERYAAVLAGGQVCLHEIEASSNGQRRRRNFPETHDGRANEVTAIALTNTFLIYSTRSGNVEFFLLSDDWGSLSGATLRHSTGIKEVCANASGTRVVIVDEQDEAFLGNPVTSELTSFPLFPKSGAKKILWDLSDPNVITVWDGRDIHTYVHAPVTRWGPMVTKLGPVEITPEGEINMKPEARALPNGSHPIVSDGGMLTCQDGSGNLQTVTSPQYHIPRGADVTLLQFTQNISLLKLKQAWDAALVLDGRAFWLALSYKAMEIMDVSMAVRVYRQLGDAGMVMGLERIAGVEDKNLLAGHISLLYDDYNKAQELFLASSRPIAALEMRRDLLHWDQALKLAQTLAPGQVPEISMQFARQLEFKTEYDAALKMFESALQQLPGATPEEGVAFDLDALQSTCMAGIARCTLRLGDLRRGMGYVEEVKDLELCRDCARILEGMKQLPEAAALYEMGAQYDRAAAIYIRTKNLAKASKIIDRVSQVKLLAEYAHRCEKDQQYEEAAKSFERAHDMDSVARLYLDHLNNPEKAFEIVRQTTSSTGAQLVARYCKAEGNFRGTIEFLLMAKCYEDAFSLAKSHNCMDLYVNVLGDGIGPDEANAVAAYYEGQHELGQAGQFYALCGQYARALRLFLQCGEREVDRAIDVVGRAKNDMLTHTLIDFLMGETDGVPKEPVHIYRLQLALGNYQQAAKTAIIIARQEQDLGSYRQAHSILYETIKELEDHKAQVPQSLRRPFILLHSYLLVRKLLQRDDHEGAARMLLRAAQNISKFPAHKVQILTSTVIEARRAGLKASAFEYAKTLMRQEHRQQMDSKMRRKIENMIRKRTEESDSPESLSPCPISNQQIPATVLECPTTRDPIPMCVVTGQHMIADDWCICPRSGMPALYSEYLKYLEVESAAGRTPTDPVTGTEVSQNELRKCTRDEVDAYLAAYNMTEQEPETEGED